MVCRGKQTSVSLKEVFRRMRDCIAKPNEFILSPVGWGLDLISLECVLTRVIKSRTSKSKSQGLRTFNL